MSFAKAQMKKAQGKSPKAFMKKSQKHKPTEQPNGKKAK